MKREFTKLMAALALLTFLAVPMGMRGQTKATVTDNMTASALAATSTSYTAFSNVSLTSDAVYAGKSALNNNANIQLRSSGSDCGIVTTVSGGKIKSITINVASGSNTIDVYGKNTAYTGAAQLYNSTNQGTKLGSVSSTGTITVSGDYEYVGVRSYNGAVYISSISFVWETASSTATATTVTIDDSGITNTDVYVNTAAGSLSATVTENVNNTTISGATVTWSSSDTNVATVGENGAITLVAAGTTTITASYAGESGVYAISSATYELTVTSSEPYVQPTTIEITPNYTFWGKTGQFSGDTYSELEGSKDNVTLNWTKGSGSTYANLSAMRFYKDNNLTFTAPEGYEIVSIKLEVSGTYSDLTFSPTGYDNTTTTWTGSSATITMSRPSNASSYSTISKFTITLAPIGNAVATTTTINMPPNFNTDIYQGTTAGTLTATVKDNNDNAISGATVTWESSNPGVATIDANGAVTLVAVGTTTITASYAGVEDQYRPSEGIYELTVIDSNAPGTQNNPYTVAQAIAATPSSGTTANVYIHGIVSRFHNTSIVGDGTNFRYYISDDGTSSTELLVYKGKGLNNEPFANANDLLVGDEVTICGGLTMFNNVPEIAADNYLVSLTHKPTITLVSNDPTFVPNNPYLVEFTNQSGGGDVDQVQPANFSNELSLTDFYIRFCDSEGNVLTERTTPDWFLEGPSVTSSSNQFYLHVIVDANVVTTPRTCYFKVGANDGDTPVYSDLVTVTQAAAPQPIITVTPSTVNATAAETEGTLAVAYENVYTDGGVVIDWYEDAQGTTLLNEAPSWIEADFATGDITTIEYIIGANTGDARTAYFKVTGVDHYSHAVYSDMVTINQAAPVPTFDITFDVGDGIFVGNEDFPEDVAEKEAGTYTLPSATKALHTFTGWNVGDETYAAGAEYTVSSDVDFVAGYAPGVMYDFTNLNNFFTDNTYETHPTAGTGNNHTNVTTLYYNNAFHDQFTASGSSEHYFNTGGYFMLEKNSLLTLPTFNNYKITQVKFHSSSSHSTLLQVSIVSDDITVAAAQIWSATSADYTYDIPAEYQTSALTVKAVDKNAQFTSITLVLKSYNPNALATMDAIYAKAVEVGATSTEVEVDFGGWIVTGVHNNDVFVTDGTKGFVIQEEDHGFEVGNTLTGTVTCNIELAGSFNARITGVKAGALTIGQGTPMATTIPMDELSGINTGALVTYNGLTYNNGTLSDGVNTIKKTNFLYNSNNDFTNGFVYNVTGVIWGYSNDVEINPRSANDIVKAPTSIIFTVNNTVFTPNDAYHIELPYLPSGGFVDHVVCINFPNSLAAEDFNVEFCDADGNSLPADPSWIEQAHVTLLPEWSDDPTLYLEVNVYNNADDEARTAYFKVWAYSSVTDQVYSDIVTVTQAANVVTYSLATEIVSGKHYIITSGTDGSMKAMGSQNTNNRAAVSVTATNGVIPETEGVYEVVIIGPDVDGYYTLYDVTNEKYLYAAGQYSGDNYLRTQDDIDDRARWTIAFNNNNAVIKSVTTETERTLMRYNSGSNCFSCYGSSQQPIYLFAKDNEPTVSYEKEITSYGTSLNGGYYLIASPVGQVTPTESNEFLTNDYDLYAFDQSKDAEWRNYEAGSFNLISGRGYLYANNGENVKLTFEGYPYVGNGQVMLAYDGDVEFAGWNLIGNPFGKKATLNMTYYSLNEEGSALNTFLEESDVEEMEGVFVKATGAGQSVKFTPASNQANSVSQLNIKVTRNRSAVLDNAIVRFDNGMTLDKFQLRENSTKVYFTEGNHDYAIVASEAQGEMPVNFKAENNGTYTLSVEPKNVEMNYLHLIDNKTGADVDLLATPSYTFEASNDDYESRFRLVFKANADVEENGATETFAYFNGSEWVINNPSTGSGDNATLQVIDMMGRVLSSETLNGNANVTLNQAAGIYMLRLVNGENVKVQKVVVR